LEVAVEDHLIEAVDGQAQRGPLHLQEIETLSFEGGSRCVVVVDFLVEANTKTSLCRHHVEKRLEAVLFLARQAFRSTLFTVFF
jgi:hypothetical protein